MKKFVLICWFFTLLASNVWGFDQTFLKAQICKTYQLSKEQCNSIPDANIVERRFLRIAWLKAQDKAIKQWKETLSESEIQTILDYNLKGIVGFFSPRTEEIYVYNYSDHCKLASVIIHEFVHYVQYMRNQFPSFEECQYNQGERNLRRWILENRAYTAQGIFFKKCKGE